tara:strand:+ start:99804 stop:100610 length:807 start_codon:yes stop_codon:yes gene_type:complete
MEFAGYFLTLIMGVSLGLLGGGGSILTVPILIYLFKINPVDATAYSLFIVGLAAGFGGFKKAKEGYVNFKVGAIFATPAFMGVFLARAYIIPKLPDTLFSMGSFVVTKGVLIMLIFAIMMIAASVTMIKGRKETIATSDVSSDPKTLNFPLIGLEGLVVGLLTGFVGAGGGFLIIPALVVLAGLNMKVAVGTSLMIISVKSLLGFLGDVMVNSNVDWTFLLILSGLSVVGIFIGSYLSQFVSDKKLKQAFGYFVLIMGTFILAQQIYS